MNNRTRTRETSKHITGPGGIDCPCCTAGGKAAAKVGHRRTIRRRDRLTLRREILRGEREAARDR